MLSNDEIELHVAHILAVTAAGVPLRAVFRLSRYGEVAMFYSTGVPLLLLCHRRRACAHCRRFLQRCGCSYLEMGLVHEPDSPVEVVQVPGDPPAAADPIPQGVTP